MEGLCTLSSLEGCGGQLRFVKRPVLEESFLLSRLTGCPWRHPTQLLMVAHPWLRPNPKHKKGRRNDGPFCVFNIVRSELIPKQLAGYRIAAYCLRSSVVIGDIQVLLRNRTGKAQRDGRHGGSRRLQGRCVEAAELDPRIPAAVVQGDPFLLAYLLFPVGGIVSYSGCCQVSLCFGLCAAPQLDGSRNGIVVPGGGSGELTDRSVPFLS